MLSASEDLRSLNVSDTLGHKLFDKGSMVPVEQQACGHIIEDCKLATEIKSSLQQGKMLSVIFLTNGTSCE